MENTFFKKYKKQIIWIVDLIINVVIVFGVVLLFEKFIAAPFNIYGPSMCDNLNVIDKKCVREYGEKIILVKAGYYVSAPQRGDVIVFTPKFSNEKYFIKRIIGLPGETVEILNGEVYITNKENPTGKKLEEPYLNDTNKGNTASFETGYKVFQVPEGEYFTLGDNRTASTDARSCFQNPYGDGCKGDISNAFVPLKNIEGKAWLVFWPLQNWRLLSQPQYDELNQQTTAAAANQVPATNQ